ncbi:MAG: transglycosylase [Desulfovibrionaceae bacterium CG1_02_65_16]|nr:MAG: transglycosylase [Desulfovibrionaceae bacterium CG1_02_65_16]
MNGILLFIVIGLVAGWLAGVLVKGGGFGILGDIVVGVLGAVIGGYCFGVLGIGGSGILGEILIATVGAVLLIFVLRLVRRV